MDLSGPGIDVKLKERKKERIRQGKKTVAPHHANLETNYYFFFRNKFSKRKLNNKILNLQNIQKYQNNFFKK
jgi:hypothetical protein